MSAASIDRELLDKKELRKKAKIHLGLAIERRNNKKSRDKSRRFGGLCHPFRGVNPPVKPPVSISP
jgi:hypothetical protein